MLAGDRNYFVCDMTCDVAIHTYMNGEPYIPLLSQDVVDAAMKNNKTKALREYMNKPTNDGGVNQIVKWGTIRRSEQFYLPTLSWQPGEKYVFAFDPARTNDNSIIGVMRIYEDKEFGWCGDIVNVVNMIDTASSKGYKLDTVRQLNNFRDMLVSYNGRNPDYEYIDLVLLDSGSGGQATSYSDNLLNDFKDSKGNKHRGLIDTESDIYKGYDLRYPNAADKIRLISPKNIVLKCLRNLLN